jgi:hypothetical protein
VSQLKPGHVLGVIDTAMREINLIKDKLGITDKTAQPARDAAKVPSDVPNAIVKANRQLNLLLEHPFSPGDVYAQIALAPSHAARLLAQFPAARAPQAPAFERKKRPGDVFQRLLGYVASLRAVVGRSGLQMMEPPTSKLDPATTLPSDCYDAAALAVGELAFLHAHAHDASPLHPFESHGAARKLPSHWFQAAGLLEAQVAELGRQVEGNPDWLKK